MKKVLLTGIAVAAFCGTPTLAAPPAAPMFNWTGFYIGGNAGGGWTKSQEGLAAGLLTPIAGVATGVCGIANPAGDCRHSLDGFIGGGQIGYNWQKSKWVFGVETSFSGSDVAGSVNGPAAENVYTTKIKSLLLIAGRLGYAWDRVLIYGKAGYAGGSVKFSLTSIQDFLSSSRWHSGGTIGAGIEYAWPQNWILGVEYNYVDLGNKGHPVIGSMFGGHDTVNVDLSGMHTVLARLSYKFSGQ